jgi:hypothetical protein
MDLVRGVDTRHPAHLDLRHGRIRHERAAHRREGHREVGQPRVRIRPRSEAASQDPGARIDVSRQHALHDQPFRRPLIDRHHEQRVQPPAPHARPGRRGRQPDENRQPFRGPRSSTRRLLLRLHFKPAFAGAVLPYGLALERSLPACLDESRDSGRCGGFIDKLSILDAKRRRCLYAIAPHKKLCGSIFGDRQFNRPAVRKGVCAVVRGAFEAAIARPFSGNGLEILSRSESRKQQNESENQSADACHGLLHGEGCMAPPTRTVHVGPGRLEYGNAPQDNSRPTGAVPCHSAPRVARRHIKLNSAPLAQRGEKLAALTPRPRINPILYHGVLPRAPSCARVVAYDAFPGIAAPAPNLPDDSR